MASEGCHRSASICNAVSRLKPMLWLRNTIGEVRLKYQAATPPGRFRKLASNVERMMSHPSARSTSKVPFDSPCNGTLVTLPSGSPRYTTGGAVRTPRRSMAMAFTVAISKINKFKDRHTMQIYQFHGSLPIAFWDLVRCLSASKNLRSPKYDFKQCIE